MMSVPYAVRLENVTKSFGSRTVLKDVSFEVPAGEAFCILGRSGTGKSVTLKHIVGLVHPDSGRVFVEGQEISRLKGRQLVEARKRLGFLFQNAALFDSITVGENVAFPLRRHTRLNDSQVREQAMQKLCLVGLEQEYEKMPSELSGGMRKRAGLARALAMSPSILLVDEPSSGLDPITSAGIDELLLSLKESEQVTIILVTHNIPSARRISDELIVIHEGHIIVRGDVHELDRSDNPLVKRFMVSTGGG